jgi:molybdopterin converting factor small subunit
MSIKVNIPTYMRNITGDVPFVEVTGKTVGECLQDLIKKFPPIGPLLFSKDNQNELFEHLIILVNKESSHPELLARKVKEGDELDIFVIIGGG